MQEKSPASQERPDRRTVAMIRFPRPATRSSLRAASILVSLGLAALPLAACTTAGPQVRGYVIDDKAVAEIQPGMDAQKVLTILGTPSTVSTVGNQSWYYISQNTNRKYMFQKPEITDQRVLVIRPYEPRSRAKEGRQYS